MLGIALGIFFFLVVINIVVLAECSVDNLINEYSRCFFYQRWEENLPPKDNKATRFFLAIIFFIPTIIAVFSRCKHSNE